LQDRGFKKSRKSIVVVWAEASINAWEELRLLESTVSLRIQCLKKDQHDVSVFKLSDESLRELLYISPCGQKVKKLAAASDELLGLLMIVGS